MTLIWIVICAMLVVVLMMMMMMGMMYWNAAKAVRGGKAFAQENPELVPRFSEVETGFMHRLHGHIAQPVLDMVVFDALGDGSDAVAITGGEGQHDAVLVFRDGQFTDMAAELGLAGDAGDISYSMVAEDIDGDGRPELIVGRQSGVYVYSRAQGDTKFQGKRIEIALPADATPVGLTTSDTTKSGYPDLMVATFIDHRKHSTANFNDPAKRATNAFWRNNGDGTFRDASVESGLDLHENTFLAQFVDLNGNGYDDLVLGTNTARGYVFENMKDGTFKKHILPIGYGFWMGIATHDFTGNGFPDIYLTNTGTSVPSFLMKGDLTGDQALDTSYRLLENDGNFGFRDIAPDLGLANPGFGWGMVLDDFTNSGEMDIMVTENFIGMPMNIQKYLGSHGSFYVKGADGKYQNIVLEAGLSNKRRFGYRAISADLDGNGFRDLLIANIDGPLRAFINGGK